MANITNGTAYFKFGNPKDSCSGKGVCKMAAQTANPSSTITKTCTLVNLRSSNDVIVGSGKFNVSMDIVFTTDFLNDLLTLDPISYAYVANLQTIAYIPDLASMKADFKFPTEVVHLLWSTAVGATAVIPAMPSSGSSPLWNITRYIDVNNSLIELRVTIDNILVVVP